MTSWIWVSALLYHDQKKKKSSFDSKSRIVCDNRPHEVPWYFMCGVEWYLLSFFILWNCKPACMQNSACCLFLYIKLYWDTATFIFFHTIFGYCRAELSTCVRDTIPSPNQKYLLSGPYRKKFQSLLYIRKLWWFLESPNIYFFIKTKICYLST